MDTHSSILNTQFNNPNGSLICYIIRLFYQYVHDYCSIRLNGLLKIKDRVVYSENPL